MSTAEVCRKHSIAETTVYRWQEPYRRLSVAPRRKFKQLNAWLKKLVAELVDHGISERLACRLVGVYRSSDRYPPLAESEAEVALRATIHDLTRAHPRYGYRRITALLRQQGEMVNP